jgi:hypothetical protein
MQVQNDLDDSVTDEDLASANALQRSQKFSKVLDQVLQTGERQRMNEKEREREKKRN